MMEKENLVVTCKIADMYKNGYYVEKNQEEYKEIIENLYQKNIKMPKRIESGSGGAHKSG